MEKVGNAHKTEAGKNFFPFAQIQNTLKILLKCMTYLQ